MPHYLGNTLVVTQQELIPLCFPSYDALRMRLKRYATKNYGIKRAMLGGNGRQLLVDFDSLEKEDQDKIGDPRKLKNPLQSRYKIDADATIFYHDFQYPDGSYLVPDTRDKLIVNASMLTALVQLEADRETERISKGGSLRGILNTLYTDAHNFNEVLAQQKKEIHSLNGSLRRFKQQYKEFKTDSYVSLIKDAKGHSKQNARKINKQVQDLLNNLFAGRDYKPNATEVAKEYEAFIGGYMEVVNEKTGLIYDPKGFPSLSVGAITNFLRTYESKIGTYTKRSGDRQKLMVATTPYQSLEQPHFGGSMISIDDRQPPFYYNNKKDRMWWYLGIDLASECITAWAYGKTKEELILNFYRQMVRNYAQWGLQMPDALECESSLNSSFKNTFLQEGSMFQNVQIHPNSARSKRIEAYFKPLRYEVEKKQEGWVARPFAKSEANQASSEKTPVVPYDKLVTQCFENITTWNNMPNKQDPSVSRFDYLMTRQHPDLKPTNYRGFLPHLGYKQATSCKAGIMHLQYKEWILGDNGEIYTGENLIRLLKAVEGKDIDIYWLDKNDGTVLKALVYDKQGRYICEAIAKPVASRAPIEATQSHKEARTIMERYTRTVTSYMATQSGSIDKVSVIDHRTPTISNTFTIDGFDTYQPSTTEAEDLGAIDQEEEYTYNPNSADTAVSWRNSFK